MLMKFCHKTLAFYNKKSLSETVLLSFHKLLAKNYI
jgi:hypothetical protein